MRIVDDALLQEFRAAWKCEWCNKPTPSGCDPHHLFARGMGGGGRLDVRINLISLCRECHTDLHDGKIGRDQLAVVIVEREIWRLQRMAKGGTDGTETRASG